MQRITIEEVVALPLVAIREDLTNSPAVAGSKFGVGGRIALPRVFQAPFDRISVGCEPNSNSTQVKEWPRCLTTLHFPI